MKKLIVTMLAVAVLFGFGAQAAWAQAATGTITGKAIQWSGAPVSGATIRLLAGPLETDKEYARATTAADGTYAVALAAGQSAWVHIDTYGSWWGYSYNVPFTLRAGETVSQVYFAIGPRDVKELAIPAPISDVAGLEATEAAPVIAVNTTPVDLSKLAAQAPVSNVKPLLGSNAAPASKSAAKPVTQPASKPAPQPAARPQTLPSTGADNFDATLPAMLLTGLVLIGYGLAVRRKSAALR